MHTLKTCIADVTVQVVQIPRRYVTRVAEGGAAEGKGASLYYVVQFIGDDGVVGVGEISDIEPEWQPPEPDRLRDGVRQALVGLPLVDETSMGERIQPILAGVDHPELRRLTACCLEMAWLDLMGRCTGLPVSNLLGSPVRDRVPVSWVAYIRSTEEVIAEVEERRSEGFSAFKLKVGLDAEEDVERLRLTRSVLGPEAHLRVDASGAWDFDEAVDQLRRLGELGVDAVETPLAVVARSIAKDRPDLINVDPETPARELARLRAQVKVPIIEHVGDFDDSFLLALIAHRSVDAVNVIPAQAGGLRRARRLLQLAESAQIPALLGSTVELGIGTAAALHVAGSSPAVSWASDLVGPGLLTADIVTPDCVYEAGCLRVPPGPGLGINLSPSALERWSV